MELTELVEQTKELMAQVLDAEEYRSIPILAAELQTEYPEEYKDFVVIFTNAHNLHGCGYRRGHINSLATILEQMESDGLAEKIHEDGKVLWRKKS